MTEFYKKEGIFLILKQNRNFEITIFILLFLAFIYFIYTGERFEIVPYWVFLILPIILFLYRICRNVIFDSKRKILQISIFGFLKQEHLLQNFEDILIINHKSYYFFNNGKEVKLLFRYNSEAVEISLIRKNSFKEIDEFVEETKEIIASCLKYL